MRKARDSVVLTSVIRQTIQEDKGMMNTMFRMYYGKLLQQLSVDLNCTPDDLQAEENIITV